MNMIRLHNHVQSMFDGLDEHSQVEYLHLLTSTHIYWSSFFLRCWIKAAKKSPWPTVTHDLWHIRWSCFDPAEACMAAAKELEKEEEANPPNIGSLASLCWVVGWCCLHNGYSGYRKSVWEDGYVHSGWKLCEIDGCNTSYSLVSLTVCYGKHWKACFDR